MLDNEYTTREKATKDSENVIIATISKMQNKSKAEIKAKSDIMILGETN